MMRFHGFGNSDSEYESQTEELSDFVNSEECEECGKPIGGRDDWNCGGCGLGLCDEHRPGTSFSHMWNCPGALKKFGEKKQKNN